MKKQPYSNENLIQQVQNYLNKILSETGIKQRQLKDSINNTLDILKKDLKLVQSQNKEQQQEQSQSEHVVVENNDTTSPEQNVEEINKTEESEISKQDDTTEIPKYDEATEISNISEISDKTNNIPLIG